MGNKSRDSYSENHKREEKYGGDSSNYQEFHDALWEEIEPVRKSSSEKEDPPQEDWIIVPGGCSNCLKSYKLKIKRSDVNNYTYTCPNCGRVISVKTQSAIPRSLERDKALFAISVSIYGAMLALFILTTFHNTLPVILMLIYDVWMILHIFTKKPKTTGGVRFLAVIFFLISFGLLAAMLHYR